MRKIVVMQTVRVFEGVNDRSLLLRRTGEIIEPGTEIHVLEKETRCYDHNDLPAFPFDFKGRRYYILERELDPTPDLPLRTDWNQSAKIH